MKSYKELDIWTKGISFVKEIYKLTKNFPKEELYGLTNQLRRASVSVPANIAEGWGRESSKSFISFLKISRGSLFEVDTLILIAESLKYIDNKDLIKLQNEIELLGKMINSLINKIENKMNVD